MVKFEGASMGHERHLNIVSGQNIFYITRNLDMNHLCAPRCKMTINKIKLTVAAHQGSYFVLSSTELQMQPVAYSAPSKA